MDKNKLIGTILPGQWDSIVKASKKLDFLKTIQINDGILKTQIKQNSYILIDFSGAIDRKIQLSFLTLSNEVKELATIVDNNKSIKIYEFENKYVFTNGSAFIPVKKYMVDSESVNIPKDIICQDKETSEVIMPNAIVTKSRIIADITIRKPATMFKMTKKKGPIDFIVINDVLVAIENKYGSRFPMVQNAVNDVLDKEPTSILRSFSFDLFDGGETTFKLFELQEDSELTNNMPSTWLYAKIIIDTSIAFYFLERLIPISKNNWRN